MFVLQVLISNLYLHTQNTNFLLKISNGCFYNLLVHAIDSLKGPIVLASDRYVIANMSKICYYFI